MCNNPKGIFLAVVIASLVALLVGNTLDIGGVQTFVHKGINVQTDICEGAGRTLGITKLCTATNPTTVSTSVTLDRVADLPPLVMYLAVITLAALA